MPAPPEPGLDVRHWELAEKLRAAQPRPSARERALHGAALAPQPAIQR